MFDYCTKPRQNILLNPEESSIYGSNRIRRRRFWGSSAGKSVGVGAMAALGMDLSRTLAYLRMRSFCSLFLGKIRAEVVLAHTRLKRSAFQLRDMAGSERQVISQRQRNVGCPTPAILDVGSCVDHLMRILASSFVVRPVEEKLVREKTLSSYLSRGGALSR